MRYGGRGYPYYKCINSCIHYHAYMNIVGGIIQFCSCTIAYFFQPPWCFVGEGLNERNILYLFSTTPSLPDCVCGFKCHHLHNLI